MSSVVISGDTSGAITLAAPAVAGTTTLTLPATTGTVLNDATVGVCRAWVNFNGTGTPAIRASFNVTNITDNGTADYTVNFTTAMTDTNYCAVIYGYESGYYVINAGAGQTKNTGSFAIGAYYTNASSVTWSLSNRDLPQMNVAIFR